MNDIPKDLAADRYVAAIEENLSGWITVFGKLGRVYENDPPGVRRTITKYPVSVFNSIMDTHLAPEQTDAAIQCVVSDARVHQVPVLWWVVPSTQPPDLRKHLEQYGFTVDDDDPGMAVDLERPNDASPAVAGLSICVAQGDAAQRQWSITMQAGFEIPSPSDSRIDAWWHMLREADPETMLAYTGFLDGKAVATSLLFLTSGVAGIYAVGTIPEARRKGIGAWMTLRPLIEARSKGCKTGVLFASEMGLNVYRSLGFQEYCRVASYRWIPE